MVKSGLLGGHAISYALPIHLIGNQMSMVAFERHPAKRKVTIFFIKSFYCQKTKALACHSKHCNSAKINASRIRFCISPHLT